MTTPVPVISTLNSSASRVIGHSMCWRPPPIACAPRIDAEMPIDIAGN